DLLITSWRVQNARARQDMNALQCRPIRRIVLKSLGEPGTHRFGGNAGRVESLPPLLRHSAPGFLHDQTGVAVAVSPPAQGVARQLQEVGIGIVTTQAQLEPGFAARRAVTGALVAATHVKRRDEFIMETDGVRFAELLAKDGDLDALASGGDLNF